MHDQAKSFLLFVKSILGEYFISKKVLDVGSGDINGNNRYLFKNCMYQGNDVTKGPNVTIVSKTKDLDFSEEIFDTIISTECFQLDPTYSESFKKIYSILKPNGLFLFTCASTNRPEHGTRSKHPNCSFGTLANIDNMGDYYKNLTIEDLNSVLDLNTLFSVWNSYYNFESHDLYFLGIKKDKNNLTLVKELTEYSSPYVINTTDKIINYGSTFHTDKIYKYTAIIVEPRCHAALSFVLKNFFENLSDDWGFVICHGCNNKYFLENIINNELTMYKNKVVKLVNLNIDNLDSTRYNELLKNKSFYDFIDTETFLIFQTDSLIIKENKHLINDFLEYQYVGAPWRNGKVGNGGLSLRKKSKMIEILDKVNVDDKNEDLFFSQQRQLDIYLPNFRKAQKFSVESVFYESPFGVHNCYNCLDKDKLKFLISKYPDINELCRLNKV